VDECKPLPLALSLSMHLTTNWATSARWMAPQIMGLSVSVPLPVAGSDLSPPGRMITNGIPLSQGRAASDEQNVHSVTSRCEMSMSTTNIGGVTVTVSGDSDALRRVGRYECTL
jgi:hypothetical protein